MLTFLGERNRLCDSVSRRSFLRIGAAGVGGLTLADLLRADANAAPGATKKSVINIFLSGGPTHHDTFDLKPEATSEIRGEFRPIATNCAGFEICELFPKLAQVADKFSVVRSLTGISEEHTNVQSDTGWPENTLRSIGGHPSLGSVMSKVWGPAQFTAQGSAPTFVDLTQSSKPGFLGQVHGPFVPDGVGRQNLSLNQQVTLQRLDDRKALLAGLTNVRQGTDSKGMMTALDSFTERAVNLITSGEVAKALDLRREDPRLLERYGVEKDQQNQRMILARRLIQAGTRCVSFSWGGWDTHGNNFGHLKMQLPNLDNGLATLIQDLDAHGLLNDTIILMSGEFGRTPRINGGAGRDHWARAGFFFVAGGGFRHGQAIGSTNRLGEVPATRPIHFQSVFATVYKQLGIDPDTTVLTDPNGRPQYLVDERKLITELS
ncbi:MAG: hypothetical protein FD138_839 [Planctomycetota bacterium]|nr:MAG: hypothetical protein FD138_839 [Planctomycetota bacterium]